MLPKTGITKLNIMIIQHPTLSGLLKFIKKSGNGLFGCFTVAQAKPVNAG
jgi:hypothetical protein